MKIAFFIPHLTRPKGFENNSSAHVQLPCKAAEILLKAGHQVDFLTDAFVEGGTLPDCFPSGVDLVQVSDETFIIDLKKNPLKRKILLLQAFFKMLLRLKHLIREREYQIVHFFGTERMLLITLFLSWARTKVPFFLTFNKEAEGPLFAFFRKRVFAWRHLSGVLVSTRHMEKMVPDGVGTLLLRHGIVKNLKTPEGGAARSRVLFWRDPSFNNGADLCIDIFKKLAPRYPHVSFDLAVRAESDFVDLDAYSKEVPNGEVFRFPYEQGVSLDALLSGSLCVLQPFREYTYYPQFVILESLAMGVPVVCSDLPGAEEMVVHGKNGFLFPLNDPDQAVEYIRKVLDASTEEQRQRSRHARDTVAAPWTWDGFCDKLTKYYERALN